MRETVICRDKHGKPFEVPVSDLKFRPSAYAVIIREGKVLLSPQWDGYDFPGGGVELGELVHEALAREVKEETGLSISLPELLHIQDDFWIGFDETRYHSILMYFSCKGAEGEISTDGFTEDEREYVQQALWVPLDKVDALKFYNGVDSPALIKKAAALMA